MAYDGRRDCAEASGTATARCMGEYMRAMRCLLLAAGLSIAGHVAAQTYPARPVRIVSPFPPGGPTDTVARVIATNLSDRLGQQFIVDNRPGAGGNIGMGIVARAAGDGHTILVTSSVYVVNPGLYNTIPYEPYKDFIPVTLAASTPNAIIVHPQFSARTMKDLVAYAKANPGKVNYSSSGSGTTGHLALELLKIVAGIDIQHVPYNGGGPMMTAVLSNQVQAGSGALSSSAGQIRAGLVRGLAVTGAKRSSSVPDVPTVAETGFPDLQSETISAVFVPAGTPPAVVDLLYREIVRAMQRQDVRERLIGIGVEPVANSPTEFTAYLKSEIPKWSKVIKQAGIRAD
jgi:tripartite-type tricarboxylate transporter receptor subunit TctC